MNVTEHYCHYIEKVCPNIKMIKTVPSMFFAYPSEPATSADAMQEAVKEIQKNKNLNIQVTDWYDLDIEGMTSDVNSGHQTFS